MPTGNPYAYIAARREDDERRPDPVSALARRLIGQVDLGKILEQAPGVRGAQRFVQNIPTQTALGAAMDVAARFNYGAAQATRRWLESEDLGETIAGYGEGFTGEVKPNFAEVLEEAGIGRGPETEIPFPKVDIPGLTIGPVPVTPGIQTGPIQVNPRGVVGLALDVVTDPLTYATLGTGSGLRAGMREVSKKAAKEAAEAGLGATAQRAAGDAAAAAFEAEARAKGTYRWGSTNIQVPFTRVERNIVPFDALTSIGHAVDVTTSRMPGVSAVKSDLRQATGEVFEKLYNVKIFPRGVARATGIQGAPEMAEGLMRAERSRRVFRQEANQTIDDAARRIAPLTEEQRALVLMSHEAGVRISEASARVAPLEAAIRHDSAEAVLARLPDETAARSLARAEVAWRLRESTLKNEAADLSTPIRIEHNGKPYTFEPDEAAKLARSLGAVPDAGAVPGTAGAAVPPPATGAAAPSRWTVPAEFAEGRLRSTGDDAVDIVLRWYQDEYRPTFDVLKRELGLRTFLDNYFYHVFPDMHPELRRLLDETGPPPTPGRTAQLREARWPHRLDFEGYSLDPLVAIAAEQLRIAGLRSQTMLNDTIRDALDRYGRRLREHEAPRPGYGEYQPRGQHEAYQAVTVTSAGRKRINELFRFGGGVKPGEAPIDAAARVAAAPRSAPGTPSTTAFSVATPGRMYAFEIQARSLDELVTSHTDAFTANPAYPEGLQARLRGRAANRAQVGDIASRLNPDEMLVDSHRLDTGPPIIGDDLAVESGNGRVMGLRKARAENPRRWEAYQRRVREVAADYGLDPDGIPPDAVLVRVRRSEVPDRGAFAAEANQPPTKGMSPLEVAAQDASRLPDDALTDIRVAEGQRLDDALLSDANARVMRAYLQGLPTNELSDVSTAAGTLNAQGLRRLQDAILLATYRGTAGRQMAEALIEGLEPALRTSLYESLPALASAEALIRRGARAPDQAIAEDFATAVNLLVALRRQGIKVSDYLAQLPMFEEGAATPIQRSILQFLADNARNPSRTREFLRGYAEAVRNAADPRQTSFMMEGLAPASKEDLVAQSMSRAARDVAEAPALANTPIEAVQTMAPGARWTAHLADGTTSPMADMAGTFTPPAGAAPGSVPLATGRWVPPAQIVRLVDEAGTPRYEAPGAPPMRGPTAPGAAATTPAAPGKEKTRPGKAGPLVQPGVVQPGETVEGFLQPVIALKPTERWELPDPIARHLNTVVNPGQMLTFLRMYDSLQALWKSSVTTIWPGFHARNASGGAFLNWQAGIASKGPYIEALKIQRAGKHLFGPVGETVPEAAGLAVSREGRVVPIDTPGAMPIEEFVREAKLSGALSHGYFGDEIRSEIARAAGREPSEVSVGDLTGWMTGPGHTVAAVGKRLGMSEKRQRAFRKFNLAVAGQIAGQAIEDNLRLAHILGRMELGDTFQAATQSARRYHLDYSDLSDAERNLRRLVPFYRWSRGNIPNQLERIAAEPRQAATVSKVANAATDEESLSDEERVLLGDYAAEALSVVVGKDKSGLPRVIAGFGMPIEDINTLYTRTPTRTMQKWLSMLGPLPKGLIERGSGVSMFTGRPIDDPNYQNYLRTAYPFVKDIPGIRDFLLLEEQQYTTKDGERVYYQVDPWRMWALTSVLGRLYASVGKATDTRKDVADRALNLLTGARVTSADVQRAAAATVRGEWGYAQQRVLDERNHRLNEAAQGVLKARGIDKESEARRRYRQTRGRLMTEAAVQLDLLQTRAEAQQAEGSEKKALALRALRDPVDRAVAEYHAIDLEDPEHRDEFGMADWGKFIKARERFLDGLSTEVRAGVRRRQLAYIDKLPDNAATIEREYQWALEAYQQYTRLDPYAVTVPNRDLERMRELARAYTAQPDERARGQWYMALPREDQRLYGQYRAISQQKNPQRTVFERQHPELHKWGFVR